MATSGTTNFNPSLGELTLFAFNLVGVRPTELTQQHMENARMAANLVFSRWNNKGVNLWKVEQVIVPLVAGQSGYPVDSDTINILDAYMQIVQPDSTTQDRIILPISRSEYATYPNKEMQGFTTVYWLDRLLSPTVTLWPVPDGYSAQNLVYYRSIVVQDAGFAGGQTLDLPSLWFETFALSLASWLAMIYAPDKAQLLKAAAEESYNIAADQNTETANFYITPMLNTYWRP